MESRTDVGPSFGSGIAVAFLDRTLVISDGSPGIAWAKAGAVESIKRRQPLRVPPSTPLIAVVRIEGRRPIAERTLSRLSSEILESARVPGVSMVQIDFDAVQSQRVSYLQLLRDVRSQLPREVRLSVTALASWCHDDSWIDGANVDEIVPMLFRMGPDTRRVTTRLREYGRWPVAACNGALGVSLDERWDSLPAARRVYVFNPRAWRREDLDRARRLLTD